MVRRVERGYPQRAVAKLMNTIKADVGERLETIPTEARSCLESYRSGGLDHMF